MTVIVLFQMRAGDDDQQINYSRPDKGIKCNWF